MVSEIVPRGAAGNGPKAVLTRRIALALLDTPFQSAQQLSTRIGNPAVTAKVVQQLLYGEPGLFEILGPEQPPIWAVRPQAESLIDSWRRVPADDEPEAGEPEAEKSHYAGPPLRAWQSEAIDAWLAQGYRGLLEAVTGSGKTAVGIRAVALALDEGRQAVVLVPGIDLQNQWFEKLRAEVPSARVARLGGGGSDRAPANWDVLVATVQTASQTKTPIPAGSLLVADEVHRYGAQSFSKALLPGYEWRLGLTATLERSDDGVEEILRPYFGAAVAGCDYARARADGILAPVRVALVGVDFTARERARYDRADEIASKAKKVLVDGYGAPENPFGEFMRFVTLLAREEGGAASRQAQRFLKAFAERREILADCEAKLELVRALPISELLATQSICFTERTDTAEAVSSHLHTVGLPCGYVGSTLTQRERATVLDEFRSGALRVLAAPRVLDEGIDVPDAQLGLVLAASRTRRQMIQRMGRVIRPKSDGRTAVFVISYVRGTSEDPATGAHEAFLEELLGIADEQQSIDASELPNVLRTWLTSPPARPHPARITTPADFFAQWPARPRNHHPEATTPEPITATRPPADAPAATEPAISERTETAPDSDAQRFAAATTGLARIGAALEIEDPAALWAKTMASRPWMTDTEVEWEAESLCRLTRPEDGDITRWQHTLRSVVTWAVESPDPIDEFLTLVRELRQPNTDHTDLLKFAATVRGVEPAGLL